MGVLLVFVSLQPRSDCVPDLFRLVLRDVPENVESLEFKLHLGVRCREFAGRGAKAGTFVRAERQDRLAVDLRRVEERVNDHRGGRPPVRVAEINRADIRKIGDLADKFRACLRLEFLFREFDAGRVFLGIGLFLLELPDLRTGLRGNLLRDLGGVPLGDEPDRIVLARMREVDDDALFHFLCFLVSFFRGTPGTADAAERSCTRDCAHVPDKFSSVHDVTP